MAGHVLQPTQMPDARFNACMPFTAKEEGGDSNDPHDKGGNTSRGVIQTEYTAWRKKKGLADQDVRNASDDEITQIFYQNYWLPNCPKMPTGVDLVYFDMRVNSGNHATVLLQRTLNIQQDSDEFVRGHEYIGPVTLGALAKTNPKDFVTALSAARLAWYVSLADYTYFGDGWSARTKRIRDAALEMAQSATPPSSPAQAQATTIPEKKMSEISPITTQVKTPLPGVPALAQAPANTQDVLKQIEGAISIGKTVLPMVATFWPPARMVVALMPVLDEVLAMLDDFQRKSGTDLIEAIGTHIENIGGHVQVAAPNLKIPAASFQMPQSSGPSNTSSTPIG